MISFEALFITEIVLLLLVGRLFGEATQRIGQPAVMMVVVQSNPGMTMVHCTPGGCFRA
jgi:hypothetical protein